MTELLELKGGERVLEIGTGSGYQTAVLAELAGEVFTVEFFPRLAERARVRLGELGYTNIEFRTGDGAAGWAEAGPYDAIILTCAPGRVPAALIAQMKEGGRLVLPEGPEGVQTLKQLRMTKGAISEREICQVCFVPLQEKT